jgi:hypothetical protein
LYEAGPEEAVKTKQLIVALLVASVAAAGGLAYVLRDDGGRGGSKGPAEKFGSRRKSAPDVGFGDADFEGESGASGASGRRAAFPPEQEAMLRSALEKLGNETAVRAAFTAGVAEPWPLPDAQKKFEECVATMLLSQGPDGGPVAARLCACAIRAIQEKYPREPPSITDGKARRIFREQFRAAVDECMNP